MKRFPRESRIRLGLTAVALVAVTVLPPLAAQAATPVVTAGPTPVAGAATASGSVASGGQTDACFDDQHSGANPSSGDTTGAAQVNDRDCKATSTESGAPTSSGRSSQTAGGSRAAG